MVVVKGVSETAGLIYGGGRKKAWLGGNFQNLGREDFEAHKIMDGGFTLTQGVPCSEMSRTFFLQQTNKQMILSFKQK